MTAVLVDTSVWVDHFRRHNTALTQLLVMDQVLIHPLIVGEIACGTPPDRANTLTNLRALQPVRQATLDEALLLLERESLFGAGCGVVDILLLTSALITPGAALWTLDKRLHALAQGLGVAYRASGC